jgi:sugar transferase (PEP-CTERM/EpsH1 system associated)
MTRAEGNAVVHVAHVVHRFAVGGMENGLVNLVNRLDPQRYRHTIIALTDVTEFRSRITARNVELVAMDKRPGKDPRAYLRLMSFLRHARPAIVHTRNVGTLDTVFVARLAGVPVRVHGEHGWDMHDLQGRSRKYRLLRRLCAPFVQRFVAVSADLAEWLHESTGIARSRITHIVNGVDCERFQPGSQGRASLRDEFNIPAGAIVVGTVGRLEAVKGHEQLLRAWPLIERRLAAAGREARLLIVGDGSLRATLEALARELGIAERVVFTGMRADVPQLLQAMDIFVLPSLNEGISNTLLEAMASGVPVVANRVGGNPELIDDRVTGFLVDAGLNAGPSERMAEAIATLVLDDKLRATMSAASRQRAVAEFSLETMVQRYDDLYCQVLAGGRGLNS